MFASQEDTLLFALVAEDSLNGIQASIEKAKTFYECTILEKRPQNNFAVETLFPKSGEAVLFEDQNSGADSWEWDFGNGQRSSLQSPSVACDSAGTYTVSLKVQKGICEQSFQQTLEVSKPSSIPNDLEEPWKVYPNPSQGNIYLYHPNLVGVSAQIRLYDLIGQKLWEQKVTLNGESTPIELGSGFDAGIYYLEIFQGRYNKTFKLSLHP